MALSNMYPPLRGRSVFVTCGASGLGASIVEAFVGQGALAGFFDIDDRAVNELKLRLDARERLRCWKGDVRDVSARGCTIEQSVLVLGVHLDVVVSAARNALPQALADLTREALGREPGNRSVRTSLWCSSGRASHGPRRRDHPSGLGELDAACAR